MQTRSQRETASPTESGVNVIVQRPYLAAAKALLAAAQLPDADLTPKHCDHFFYAGKADDPAGLVGLELYDDCALLRSLVVKARVRSKGLGSALIQHAEEHARSVGVHTLYLLTTTAESFFLRHGYTTASRDAAPEAIRSTREFAGLCPANSAFMSKQLRGD